MRGGSNGDIRADASKNEGLHGGDRRLALLGICGESISRQTRVDQGDQCVGILFGDRAAFHASAEDFQEPGRDDCCVIVQVRGVLA